MGLLDQVVRGPQLGGIHRVSEDGHLHHRDWQHKSLLSWRVLSVAKKQLEQRTEGGDGQQGRAGQVRAGALLEGGGGSRWGGGRTRAYRDYGACAAVRGDQGA